jgi:hypothetical protein
MKALLFQGLRSVLQMEKVQFILDNKEAILQLIAAITASIVTVSSILVKFLPRARTRRGKKVMSALSTLAMNNKEGEK